MRPIIHLSSLATCLMLLAACQSDDTATLTIDGSPRADPGTPNASDGNTNVNLGGSQDFGFFRRLLESGQVPTRDTVDVAGFFAEHHTPLPAPTCGEHICIQAMIGSMDNLGTGNNCTLLQLGFNSPIVPSPENRPPLSLALVVDVSGSMQADGKLDFVKTGLRAMLQELRDDDRLAIITYSTSAQVVFPMSNVELKRSEIVDIIDDLTPEGSTNISEGLELGYGTVLADYDSERQNRLVLLSDGQPTAGVTNTTALLNLSKRFNSEVGITTIGLGTDFNLELMRGLAQQADGNFYFVENVSAVDEVFSEEISYFTLPVAFDLKMKVTTSPLFAFQESYGSPFFTNTATAGTLAIPSVFLAHRKSHDDVGDGNTRRGGGSALLLELMPSGVASAYTAENDVAQIELSFREPGSNRIVTDSLTVRAPFSPFELTPQGFFDNEIVEKSFVMLNVVTAMELACEWFHDGRGSAAITLVRQVSAAARDYADGAHGGTGDLDIRLDADLLDQLVAVMVQQGAVDPEAPIPSNPWPRD